MKITIEVPDDIATKAPLAQLDIVLQAFTQAMHATTQAVPPAADPAPWGYDQFGTAYTSAADRTRGENLRQNDIAQTSTHGMRTTTCSGTPTRRSFLDRWVRGATSALRTHGSPEA